VRREFAALQQKKAYRDNWDPSEALFWGSLKIVWVADRLVGNYPNEVFEKRGFSLFCHECLQVIGCVGGVTCRSHPRPVPASLLSHPLKLVSQSHGGQCSCSRACSRSRGLTSTLRFVVGVQLQRRYVVLSLLKRVYGCNRRLRSFTVLLVLARVLQSNLTARDFQTVSFMALPIVLRADGRSEPMQGSGR